MRCFAAAGPSSEMNNAMSATTIGGDGRRRRRDDVKLITGGGWRTGVPSCEPPTLPGNAAFGATSTDVRVPPVGLEPTTSALKRRALCQLSYGGADNRRRSGAAEAPRLEGRPPPWCSG